MKRFTSFFISICVFSGFALACLCSITGCTKLKRFTRTSLGAFDTSTTVTAYCADQDAFDTLFDEIDSRMLHYHRLFDIYSEYDGMNNLCTVNANAGRGATEVCGEIIELLDFGKEVYSLSGGSVNIMFGAVLGIWHEYRERSLASPESAELPDPAELSAANAHCDIESLIIDKDAGTVEITDPDASIDVGAIAKGFAVEKVCAELRELGYSGVLINAGGNIAAIGTKPNGESWLTAVQNPFAGAENAAEHGAGAASDAEPDIAYKRITGGTLATSGDYQRYYEVDGKRYHHIIDPKTLLPAEYAVSVTVFSDNAALSDALSTVLFLMPPDDAVAFAQKFNSSAMDEGSSALGNAAADGHGIEIFIAAHGGETFSFGDWLPPEG